jgi:hypothetical protein
MTDTMAIDQGTMDYIMGLPGYSVLQRKANVWNYNVSRYGIDSKRAQTLQTNMLHAVDCFIESHFVNEDDVMWVLGWNMTD